MTTVTLAYNVKPGLRLAEIIHERGLLSQYFGVGMASRAITLPGPFEGRMVQRFNAARVEPGISSLPYEPVWEAEGMFHAPSHFWSLPSRLQLAQATFDAHVRVRLRRSDIYHATSGTLLWSGRKAKRLGAKVICHRRALHHVEEAALVSGDPSYIHPEAKLDRRLRLEYDLSDVILCNSHLTAASFYRQGFSEDRLAVIHNAVDTQFFSPNLSEPARASGQPRTLLYVGTVDARKGVDLLARAVKRLGNVKVTVAGRVDDKILAEQLIQAGGVILGPVSPSRLRELYRDSDALVLPSRADAFGYVVSEALACGTPALVSDACGSAEIVARYQSGLVFASESLEELMAGIEQIADPDAHETLRLSALRARPYLGWDRYAEELVAIYSAVLQRSR